MPEPFTEAEYWAIPLKARGKILKNDIDQQTWREIARAAVQGYRGFLEELFVEKKEEKAKKWWQF